MPVAGKLLKAIDAQLRKDGGASYRRELRPAIAACEDAYDDKPEELRSHLGASQLGNECLRALWYGFRWVGKGEDDPRMMRIWNRGHLEEGRFVALLRQLPGVTVWTHKPDGSQFRASIYGVHSSGSCDGASLGTPDVPDEPLLDEFKTHKDSSFTDVARKGVKDAKPEHYIQMNMYMSRMYTRRALYMAVNKDTDHLHAEIVDYDPACDRYYTERAVLIVNAVNPPQRISNNPTWWKCKFCDFHGVCHAGKPVAVNCRTCRNSVVREDGWYCGVGTHAGALSKAQQFAGCQRHEKLGALAHA